MATGAEGDPLRRVGHVWFTRVIISPERIDVDENRIGSGLTRKRVDRWHNWKDRTARRRGLLSPTALLLRRQAFERVSPTCR